MSAGTWYLVSLKSIARELVLQIEQTQKLTMKHKCAYLQSANKLCTTRNIVLILSKTISYRLYLYGIF